MENRITHYNGSAPINDENNSNSVEMASDLLEITDEMRKNISGNPYVLLKK